MATSIFEQQPYLKINVAREDFLRKLLLDLKQRVQLQTALDAGCGFGYFSAVLRDAGLQVTAFDGRQENVEAARERVAGVSFSVGNLESTEIQNLGKFDLVLCFGLLYHLENPFQAVRNLNHMTEEVLVLESICLPGSAPAMMLLDEPKRPDQGLERLAFYPSEPCIIKMCFRAGFPHVYRPRVRPKHPDFRIRLSARRRRTVLVASRASLESPLLAAARDVGNPADPWAWAGHLKKLAASVRFRRSRRGTE